MSSVLVTVIGPTGPVDLALPADQPLSTLFDPLTRALDRFVRDAGPPGSVVERGEIGPGVVNLRAPPGSWSLAPLGGDPLPPGRSLTASGVGDGDVLVLLHGNSPAEASPRPQLGEPVQSSSGRRCAVVAVVSAAGGMGRTTVAAFLAGALVAAGGGPTVAVDAHPGPGSLSERLAPGRGVTAGRAERVAPGDDDVLAGLVTAGDLLALIDHPALTRQELLACLAWPSQQLALLAARPGGGRGPPLGEHDWRRLVRGLAGRELNVVVDCGPGLGDPGARAALAEGDQAVLVVEPSPSEASRWMAGTLADRGLAAVAVSWPAPPERVSRVAETLVADWIALGITATPTPGRVAGGAANPQARTPKRVAQSLR